MRLKPRMTWILIPALLSIASSALAENLCQTDEKKLFACQFENSKKSVSICQSAENPAQIYYKFGTANHIEMTLPKNRTGKPYIRMEQFGPASTQWLKQIIFPAGKTQYILNTPQGISASLTVEGIKNPVSMLCDQGDSGGTVSDLYDLMEELGFRKK